MKRTTTLTAVILTLLSSLCFADHFETLANAEDSITIKEGEAALVLFVTDIPTLQYTKEGKRPVQFQLGLTRPSETAYSPSQVRSGFAYRARVESNPSTLQPLALAGPATLSLMTDGLVSLRVVGDPAVATK